MPTCLTCKHWKPKESGAMARQHFAICALGPRWTFMSPHHTCPRHLPAAAEVTEKRLAWQAKG